MRRADRVISEKDLALEIRKAAQVWFAENDAAGEVAKRARRIANSFKVTGHYMESIKTERVRTGKSGVVIGKRVISTDEAGYIIEYGSKNNPAYAPIRRAAESLGYDLSEEEV